MTPPPGKSTLDAWQRSTFLRYSEIVYYRNSQAHDLGWYFFPHDMSASSHCHHDGDRAQQRDKFLQQQLLARHQRMQRLQEDFRSFRTKTPPPRSARSARPARPRPTRPARPQHNQKRSRGSTISTAKRRSHTANINIIAGSAKNAGRSSNSAGRSNHIVKFGHGGNTGEFSLEQGSRNRRQLTALPNDRINPAMVSYCSFTRESDCKKRPGRGCMDPSRCCDSKSTRFDEDEGLIRAFVEYVDRVMDVVLLSDRFDEGLLLLRHRLNISSLAEVAYIRMKAAASSDSPGRASAGSGASAGSDASAGPAAIGGESSSAAVSTVLVRPNEMQLEQLARMNRVDEALYRHFSDKFDRQWRELQEQVALE